MSTNKVVSRVSFYSTSAAIAACMVLSSAVGSYAAEDVVESEVPVAFTGAPVEYQVPQGVCSVGILAYGANGGDANTEETINAGGLGASVNTKLSVIAGDTLTISVGGRGEGTQDFDSLRLLGGFGGGADAGTFYDDQNGEDDLFGSPNAAGGGGRTEIQLEGAPVVIAGGGGGAGGGHGLAGARGGDGGLSGEMGSWGAPYSGPPAIATTDLHGAPGVSGGSGGAGGVNITAVDPVNGANGGNAIGGQGGVGGSINEFGDPHGGLGGGGAAAVSARDESSGGGGGGGSSLAPTGATVITGANQARDDDAEITGHGSAILTFFECGADENVTPIADKNTLANTGADAGVNWVFGLGVMAALGAAIMSIPVIKRYKNQQAASKE